MTDFVIVAVVASTLTAPPAPISRGAAHEATNAPTVGFTVYRDAAACEEAIARMTPRPGMRLVCVPAEPFLLETASLF
jgi:hypothetical protein